MAQPRSPTPALQHQVGQHNLISTAYSSHIFVRMCPITTRSDIVQHRSASQAARRAVSEQLSTAPSRVIDRKLLCARYGRRAHVKTDAADGRKRNENCYQVSIRSVVMFEDTSNHGSAIPLHITSPSRSVATCTGNQSLFLSMLEWLLLLCSGYHRQNRLLSIVICGLRFSCPQTSFSSRLRERVAEWQDTQSQNQCCRTVLRQ